MFHQRPHTHRLLLLLLSTFLCLWSWSTPAQACLNDRQTIVLEEEYRSQYASPTDLGSVPNSYYEWHITPWVLAATGILFAGFAIKRTQRQAPATSPAHTSLLRRPLSGWYGLIIFGGAGLIFGALIITALLHEAFFPAISLRAQIVARNAPYLVSKIPGGTALRIAMIHDTLTQRYLHHGSVWYEKRNQEAQAIIAEEMRLHPDQASLRELDARDDLAVGLENLHQSEAAIQVMREKLHRMPTIPIPVIPPDSSSSTAHDKQLAEMNRITTALNMPPEQHHQYTARANLGTSLIHGSFKGVLAGNAEAEKEMQEGLRNIQESIAINPAAHFGREIWQAIVVQHFLVAAKNPDWLTTYDMVGQDLTHGWIPQRGNRKYSPFDGVLRGVDPKLSIEERLTIRARIFHIALEPGWYEKIKTSLDPAVPFDEPTLGLMGMWMYGGGPNPHSALALGNLSRETGQLEIAWEAYERCLTMAAGLSPNENTREFLVSYCQRMQTQIAEVEAPSNPQAWTEKTRKRFQSELDWGQKYQHEYQDWEARQIKAGIALDDPKFYTDFFAQHPNIASPTGNVDTLAVRYFVPDGAVDAIPASIFLAGVLMFIGSFAKQK